MSQLKSLHYNFISDYSFLHNFHSLDWNNLQESKQKESLVLFDTHVTVFFVYFSPSVLDRLNALLEPGGVLTIDERGAIDGSIPSIKPHPNFRWDDVCYTCSP